MKVVFLILFFMASNVEATIYKCTDDFGEVSFQERECKTGIEEKLDIKDNKKNNHERSMWIGPNFVDTQYSVLFKKMNIYKFTNKDDLSTHIPWYMDAYKVTGEVLEVFKGDFVIGDKLSVIVYLTRTLGGDVNSIKSNYILSFCKSNSGIYFLGTDYQLQQATKGNIEEFRYIQRNGTSHEGDEACIYNEHSLNPDKHN